MRKLLKLILIFQLLSWLGITISNFSNNPLSLLVALAINLLIWIGLWKGVDFVVNNPENETQNKKTNIIRWLLSFFFSIFTFEIGVLIAFIIRFFIDQEYVQRGFLATIIVNGLGRQFGNTFTGVGILLAFPIMYLIGKALRFARPLVPAVIFTILWFFVIFLI